MKVAYIARHDAGGNDDEGAITHALRELGHEVQCVHECQPFEPEQLQGDLALFHKFGDLDAIKRIQMPKAFWYFDLVDFPDPLLERRCRQRRAWMEAVIPLVDAGFLTDGDFAAADTTGKLYWLPQGADGRVAGRGEPLGKPASLLFTGIKGGGRTRETWVDEMRSVYGRQFRHVSHGVHGRTMADLIASHRIVLAPDGPVTDLYWSNRVWNVLGFGGFLLHPYCSRLAELYTDDVHLGLYSDRKHLHERIAHYLARPEERRRIAMAGLEHTRQRHLYHHRAEELIRVVLERGLV